MIQVFNRILIFDGSYALHRALSVPNNWDMVNSKGKRTGGIFGVLRTIQKELKNYNYFPIVVFDGGLSKRRLDIYPNYKRAQEKALLQECLEEDKTEEQLIDEEFKREYNTQRNDLIDLLPLFGIPTIRVNEWEGDDIIYILSRLAKDSIVVSDDKDLIQLIKEPDNFEARRCRIRRPLKDEFIDLKTLQESRQDIHEYVCCKSIVGDPSDNIPSACFQVGDKTASGLFHLYENCVKNNINFPETEEDLTKLCKQFDIAKRKAYLNFNESQFLSNLLLTDLSLVNDELTNEFLTEIYEAILEIHQYNNVEIILEELNELEIKTFDYKNLIDNVYNLNNMLKIEDIDKCNNIKESNEVKCSLF